MITRARGFPYIFPFALLDDPGICAKPTLISRGNITHGYLYLFSGRSVNFTAQPVSILLHLFPRVERPLATSRAGTSGFNAPGRRAKGKL